MKKKLAIIGGSYLQLPIVKKAKEMGIETHCFSWRDGAVCADVADFFYPISIIEKEEILKKCQEIGIDGITTIASDTAVVTVNYVASRMGLRSNPDKYSEVTTNKYKMRQCFLDNDVPSPRFTLVEDLGHYQITGFRFPLIVKPTDRSGSRGVEKVLDPVQLEEAVSRAQKESFEHKAIIEEFVTGREISVESISNEGKHTILQITDKITTEAPHFVEMGHTQPSRLPVATQEAIRDVAVAACNAIGIDKGPAHVEMKVTNRGPVMIELGARMGGDNITTHLVPLSTGIDMVGSTIKVALGEEPDITPTLHCSSAIRYFDVPFGTIMAIENVEDAKQIPGVKQITFTKSVGEESTPIRCSNDRIGFVIAQGKTAEEVVCACEKAMKTIKITIE